MSDPLSITASIIALLQVSKKVVDFISQLSDAPKIASLVVSELKAMDILLRRLQDLVVDWDNASIEGTVSLRSYSVLEDLVTVLSDCVLTYSELHEFVARLQRRNPSSFGRAAVQYYARWVLGRGEINAVIAIL
jgi:hypothetical protein